MTWKNVGSYTWGFTVAPLSEALGICMEKRRKGENHGNFLVPEPIFYFSYKRSAKFYKEIYEELVCSG